MNSQVEGFLALWLRVAEVALATLVGCFLMLVLDSFVCRRKAFSSKPARLTVLRCARSSGLVSLIIFLNLSSGAVRRSFTNAKAFDIPQMWWHSLASIVNITSLMLVNSFVAGNTLGELGWPSGKNWRNWVPNPVAWARRVVVACVIAAGTHLITPLIFLAVGCLTQWGPPTDYRPGSAIDQALGQDGIVYFFVVQQVCFFINGVDEESNWRGFTNAVWKKEDHHPVTMYIISGWLYAMCHSLNGGTISSRPLEYSIMVFNLLCEGAAWMYLYQTTKDLGGQWAIHDIDDIFSIWFGANSLAGYNLPAGQIFPFSIGCIDQTFLSGGVFGIGVSLLYVFQNLYTVGVVWVMKRFVPLSLPPKARRAHAGDISSAEGQMDFADSLLGTDNLGVHGEIDDASPPERSVNSDETRPKIGGVEWGRDIYA